MTIFLFSAPISCEGEKEEKLPRNNYVAYLTNDTLSEMTHSANILSATVLQSAGKKSHPLLTIDSDLGLTQGSLFGYRIAYTGNLWL